MFTEGRILSQIPISLCVEVEEDGPTGLTRLAIHCVSKWSHDQSLSFRSDIFDPRFSVPNWKIWNLILLFGPRKNFKGLKVF